jgi:hypothetical protein
MLAEVTRVAVRALDVRITGRIIAGRHALPDIAMFRSRSGREATAPVDMSPDGFALSAPVVDLAGRGHGGTDTWRVWFRVGPRELRLGHHADGGSRSRAAFRANWSTVAVGDGRFLGVRPHYEDGGGLVLSTVCFQRFAGPTQ